jgi:hypothetical protein
MLVMPLSRAEISTALRTHQKRLQMGDKLLPLTELADQAGVHRDTLYEALHGHRISRKSQIRISTMLASLERQAGAPSKLMHVRLGPQGPSLGFGVGPVGVPKK